MKCECGRSMRIFDSFRNSENKKVVVYICHGCRSQKRTVEK